MSERAIPLAIYTWLRPTNPRANDNIEDVARAAGARELANQLGRVHGIRWTVIDPHHPQPVPDRRPRA